MKTQPPRGRKKKAGKWFKYDFAFMRKVVRDYLDGNESSTEVSVRYGISSACVRHWLQRYNKGLEPFNEVPLPVMQTDSTSQQQNNQQDLQKQNEELLKKLEQANLKITGLEIMIDIAEEQLGIDIRKKPGAKQSEDYANTIQKQA